MITLCLPYPLSANRYWRTRVMRGPRPIAQTYVSPEAEAYKADVLAIARHAGARQIAGRVSLRMALYPHQPKDWHKRTEAERDALRCIDLDNALKVTLDALKGVAFGDDALVREIVAVRMEPDEKGARLVVTVEGLE
ncbi:MAG: RusA family crossover junction endodeoxyribonuclease [Armatimonadia bacterium]